MSANTSKALFNLQEKASCNTAEAKLVIVTDSANSGLAQTGIIVVDTLLGMNINIVANTLILNDKRTDPANDVVTTITKGSMFFSNDYIYVAVANNVLKRVELLSF